jgi:hypothetical protein
VKDASQAVIRKAEGPRETSTERLLKKHVPAWVVSGAVHVLLVAVLIGIDTFAPGSTAAARSDQELTVVADAPEADDKQPILTNPDIGLDAELPAGVDVAVVADVNVMNTVVPDAPVGLPDATKATPFDVIPPTGVGDPSNSAGIAGAAGDFLKGIGGGATGAVTDGFSGRSGATKDALVKAGGGSAASEAAVARGLLWLSKKQRADGSWQFDGISSYDRVAATGLALLPFLAAGQTHQPNKDNKYQKTVDAGVKFLTTALKGSGSSGTFTGSSGMYSHAIGTLALCELLGMTGDRSRLLAPAQKAVNYIVEAQGDDGSWGYRARQNGDTSIVGWQIQALQSARLCKDVVVPRSAFERARKFLDSVTDTNKRHTYGYADRSPKLSLTPVGLLCRYYGDGWGPRTPGMAAGVKWFMDRQMPKADSFDMYYYYYATQVAHFFDGPEWHKQWNPAMRDLLIARQAADGPDAGSWEQDAEITGSHTGRLGTTCLALLTLEVYYRHLPLYKRDAAGARELERVP